MASFWHKIRADFPVTQRCVYLDHASAGPMPRPVRDAYERYCREHHTQADLAWPGWLKRREQVREQIAAFIKARPDEIAFTGSTSHGMNMVAELLAPEGSVLTNDLEFPSSTLPWVWRKARIRFQKSRKGRVCPEQMRRKLDSSVRTILTSYVQYRTGYRQDMKKVARMKEKRWLVVNATQGFGAMPVDVRAWKADFLCANSYKWLLAGYGGGILYVRRKWLRQFRPLSMGWRSVEDPESMDNRHPKLRPDAGRYEWGCPPFPVIFAMGAAVNYLSQIGIERIRDRILELTDFLLERLDEEGFETVSPRDASERSGILVVKVPEAAMWFRKLLAAGFYVIPRGAGLRVAPHFYNTLEEIDRLVKALVRLRSGARP